MDSVHIVLKNILYPQIRACICIERSFARIIEALRAIGTVQLDDAQRAFVAYFGIVL